MANEPMLQCILVLRPGSFVTSFLTRFMQNEQKLLSSGSFFFLAHECGDQKTQNVMMKSSQKPVFNRKLMSLIKQGRVCVLRLLAP